jgi:hypothetical protein
MWGVRVLIFASRAFYIRGKSTRRPLNRSLGGQFHRFFLCVARNIGWVVVQEVYRKYCERLSEQVPDWLPFLHVLLFCIYCAFTCSLSFRKWAIMAWHDKLLLNVLKKLLLYSGCTFTNSLFRLSARYSLQKSPAPAREPAKLYFLTKTKRMKKGSVRRMSPKCKLLHPSKQTGSILFCPALTDPVSLVHWERCAVCERRGTFLPELCCSSVSVVF